MAANKALSKILLFSLLSSAVIPLAPRVGGINIVTPYVLTPIIIFVVLAWAVQFGRIRLSLAAKAYATAPLIMLSFILLGNDQVERLNATLPYLFGSLVFLATIILFRFYSLHWQSLVRFAYWFLAIESLIVILQFAVDPTLGRVSAYFGEGEVVIASWQNEVRVSGTFGNPNLFTQIYQLMASVVIADLLFSNGGRKAVVAAILTIMVGLVMALSLSRSGMLFYLAITIVMLVSYLKNKGSTESKAIFLLVAALMAALLVFSLINWQSSLIGFTRFASLEDSTRLQTYLGALKLASYPDVWVSGVGAGKFFEGAASYGIYFDYRSWLPVEEINSSVHNLPLKIITEFGVIVFFIYFYAVVTLIRKAFTGAWRSDCRVKMMIAWPILILFAIPLQLGTTGASVWMIVFLSVYFAVIEYYGGERKTNAAQKFVRGVCSGGGERHTK